MIFTSGQRSRELGNDAAHFFHTTRSRIPVGRTQPRTQQLVACEDIQRQVAVAVVVAVPPHGRRPVRGDPGEEPLRLMAVERDVGGVQVEHDLGGRRVVRLDEKIRQQPVQGFGRVRDLVIAAAAAGQFQPVQRALAGQRLIQFPLAAEQPQQRIVAQLLVIVEVFIAQRQPIDALRQHLR